QKGSPTNKKGILINSFHETPYFHADEYSWPITVRNQSEMNLNNLVIENKE
ncbi:MAG: hypothetical protein GX666_13400, partial [Tissierellia bacterium]|nr:hypothetical protein [Tissierellia bacterium]